MYYIDIIYPYHYYVLYEYSNWRHKMAGASKNSRTTVATQKFICPDCGGEIIMKTMIENGRLKNQAECQKCKRVERRPKDFK